MKRKWLLYISITISILILLSGCSPSPEEQNTVPYIATLNDIILPLDQYYLYLRTEIEMFEQISGGTDIWRTTIDGVRAIDVAKNSALESMIQVTLINQRATYTLSDDSAEFAIGVSENLWASMSYWEQELIPLEAVKAVIKAFLLNDVVEYELTRSYAMGARVGVFANMLADWRNDAVVVRNAYSWDNMPDWLEGR